MRKEFITLGVAMLFAISACGPAAVSSQDEEPMAEEEMMESDEEMSEEEMESDEMMDEGEEMESEEKEESGMMEDAMSPHAEFSVRIENITDESSTLLAPGAWVIFEEGEPLFSVGESDRGMGLESLAEDGDPSTLSASLQDYMGVVESGVFNIPVEGSEPAPIGPGGAYEFEFHAEAGQRLALATMLVQTNDLFYAPDAEGFALFSEDGTPVEGEVTMYFSLWDTGTEVNQPPGEGTDQAPRQSGPNIGEDEMGAVDLVDDGFSYPEGVLRVTITAVK